MKTTAVTQLLTIVSIGIVILLTSSSVRAVSIVDVNLAEYKKADSISGNLNIAGADTLASLVTHWSGLFTEYHPSVQFQIQTTGSALAAQALTKGVANIATLSRKMNGKELTGFEKKYGYKPVLIPVAIDALAIYVNKDNPLNSMTLAQVDAIMSSTKWCGYEEDITTWGDAGLSGLWMSLGIDLYGQNILSGTNNYFREHVLCQGKFKNKVKVQSGSAKVVQSISSSLRGMGYAGMGYKSAGVKTLALARKEGMPYIEATAENALAGKYPLTRFLYFYLNKNPKFELARLEKEFIQFVLSKVGQQVVSIEGYVPLPAKVVKKTLSDLEIS